MGCVQFSEDFRKEFLKVEVVVYIREELRVVLLVVVPVNSVKLRIIEFLLNLFPHVVEHVFALCLRLELIFSCIADVFGLASVYADLADAESGCDIDVFSVR